MIPAWIQMLVSQLTGESEGGANGGEGEESAGALSVSY